MNLLDKFLGLFKKSQVEEPTKYNAYPENNKIPIETKDRDNLLNQVENNFNTVTTPSLTNQPQQISGNPITPQVNLQPNNTEPMQKQIKRPFETDQIKNDTNSTDNPNFNEKPLKPYMDINDVNDVNPILAARMKKAGILTVDKKLFMSRYASMVRNAALKKISLSDYIDGKR